MSLLQLYEGRRVEENVVAVTNVVKKVFKKPLLYNCNQGTAII